MLLATDVKVTDERLVEPFYTVSYRGRCTSHFVQPTTSDSTDCHWTSAYMQKIWQFTFTLSTVVTWRD